MTRRPPYTPPAVPPDDVVTGPDLAAVAALTIETVPAARVSCHHGTCSFSLLVQLDPGEDPGSAPAHRYAAMFDHLTFAHPAARNPEVTCHARALWDHERWCTRPKGHEHVDGDPGHWTPSFGGGRWWPA